MICVVLFVLFGLSCVFFPCEGQIILPPGGDSLTIVNGSTEKIEWSLNSTLDPTAIIFRSWTFKSSRGGKDEFLGEISRSGTITISTKLYEVEIKPPATLVLKNVNASYDGTYEFSLLSPGPSKSEVDVIIAAKPSVTINCSDPTTVNEGDDFTCECRDEEGKPEANLTWYDKDGVQIGKTSYGKNILTITNVTKEDGGRYTCKAQSYILTDEESFEVIVRLSFRPNQTDVIFTKNPAVVGKSVTVMCSSNGLPEPSYTIMHNGSITVSNQSTSIIREVKSRDAGTYKCIATNRLGSDSDSKNLTVAKVLPPAPTIPSTIPSHKIMTTMSGNKTANTASNKQDDGTTVVVWHIVVTLVSGIIIGTIFSYVVRCSYRRWFGNKKPERNSEPKTSEVDTTYQELDLSNMNAEDNYQSLRVNAASNDAANDDDSTYTELNKIRDVESNYQSLT